MAEDAGVGEEVDVVVEEEEVTMAPHHLTMKLNKMEETMDTTMLLLQQTMDMMVLLRDVDVAVEGEVVEEEEDVVDSTDQMEHLSRLLHERPGSLNEVGSFLHSHVFVSVLQSNLLP